MTLRIRSVYVQNAYFSVADNASTAYRFGMQIKLCWKGERKRGGSPNISVRILDPDLQKKLQELREADVDISETFRPIAHEAIDLAHQKLQKSR